MPATVAPGCAANRKNDRSFRKSAVRFHSLRRPVFVRCEVPPTFNLEIGGYAMNVLQFVGLAKKKNASATSIRSALNEIDMEALERRVEGLEGRRADALLDDDDKAIDRLDAEIAAAQRDVERAFAAKERLEARLREAEGAEAEAARKHSYEEAQRLRKKAVEALEKRYAKAADEIVAIVKEVAAAEAAISAANRDLPQGAGKLRSAEHMVRGLPSDPQEVIDRKKLPPRWFYVSPPSWGAVEDDLVDQIEVAADGKTGRLQRSSGAVHKVVKRQEMEITTLAARPGYRPDSLAAAVSLPGLKPGEPPYWSPSGPTAFDDDPGRRSRAVLDSVAISRSADRAGKDPRPARRKESKVEIVDDAEPTVASEGEAA
jgi:uncharacterized coiled-coil protein SlyX